MDDMEKRVKQCSEEKEELEKQIQQLETQNISLAGIEYVIFLRVCVWFTYKVKKKLRASRIFSAIKICFTKYSTQLIVSVHFRPASSTASVYFKRWNEAKPNVHRYDGIVIINCILFTSRI